MKLRPVNLRTICAKSLLGTDAFDAYKHYLGIHFRERELECVAALTDKLANDIDLSEFFLGFCIPQINKEFDLLRFCDDIIVNIELKNGEKKESEIEEQLQKNEYYLNGFEGERIPVLFTYRVDTDQLFELVDGKLRSGDWHKLSELLQVSPEMIPSIESMCVPAKYLVSPFNTTSKFLSKQYFLTQRQQEIKLKIVTGSEKQFSIRGNAGTGKTLLVYDIAQTLMNQGKKVVICHCGYLNEGQLNLQRHGWNIVDLKNTKRLIESKLDEYDIIIIDEIQRIKKTRLENLFLKFKSFSGKVVLSGDPKQFLHTSENGDSSFKYIESQVDKSVQFTLTDKIRSNENVAAFIKRLFDKKASIGKASITADDIFIEYFDNKSDAISYANHLSANGWTVITQTSSLYNHEFYTEFDNSPQMLNAHHAIGQEFNNVATFIGPNYKYEGNKLIGYQTYYSSPKMLFENVTRTRTKLCLIIIDNIPVLMNVLDILNDYTKDSLPMKVSNRRAE